MNHPPAAASYRAFISYSHADRRWGDWLHKALETYRVPTRLVGETTAAGVIPRRLLPIFRDRDELASATDLGRKVNEALYASANLIVICSPRAATSRWDDEEVLAFKRLGRSDRVFCLIVDGEPGASTLPGHEAQECFARSLRFQVDGDGQLTGQPTEPIAADVRPGKDGKANAKLKLVAGMLDVGFDALRQREQQRHVRRMAAVTTLALVVMLVTSALAITAVIARRAADVARQAAERRQKQAEGLVNFMLGDLNDKLNEVHRLDIMQSVDDKAMDYFASLPTTDVTDEALSQRVTALEKIGSVRMDQNQVPAALKAYQAASVLAADLVQRSPGDVAREAAYADSIKWIGQAYWYQGDAAHALRNFKTASASLHAALATKPDDTEIAFKLATARSDTGFVLSRSGELAGARSEYEAALAIYERLRKQQPAYIRWRKYVANTYTSLGRLARQQGRLDKAIVAYRINQRIKAALVAHDPDNHVAQSDLVSSNAILGDALELCGDTEAALRHTRKAVDGAKALLAFAPTNAGWQSYFGRYSQQLGSLLRQSGQLDQATAADSDAVRVLRALVKNDRTNAVYQRELAQGLLESARLQLARHDADSAQAMAGPALEIILQLQQRHAAPALALLAGQAYTVLGRIAARRHDAKGAHGYWAEARNMIAPLAKSSKDPEILAAWGGLLLLLDQPDIARPVVKKLSAMGYGARDFVALATSKHMAYPDNAALRQRIANAVK